MNCFTLDAKKNQYNSNFNSVSDQCIILKVMPFFKTNNNNKHLYVDLFMPTPNDHCNKTCHLTGVSLCLFLPSIPDPSRALY